MKRILKVSVLLLFLGVAFIVVNLFFTNSFNKLSLPILSSTSKEFGELVDVEQKEDNFEIYKQTLSYSEFIDNDVNSKIENDVNALIATTTGKEGVKEHEKAVYKNVIDTYVINDNIVSVKVTSSVKNLYEDNYTKTVTLYNYDTKNQRAISLDDFFKDGYKDTIAKNYTDKYLLTKTGADFYTDTKKSGSCKYLDLKNYAISKTLTKENFGVSEEEYKEIFKNYIDPNKKMIAITFDDGPSPYNTYEIINILEEYNVHATFFMLGQNVQAYPEVVKRVYETGNEVANHSWNHPQLTKLSAESIAKQINDTSDAIYNITGERPKLVRPPYGAMNDTVKSTIQETLILWNIDSLDWKTKDQNQIVPLVMSDVEDGDIILLHDIHPTTTPAVRRIVEQLLAQDYQIITVSQMLEAKGKDTVNIKYFYSAH